MAISSEMSAQSASKRSGGQRGAAFLIEALVVLALLMVSLAIFVQLFAKSQIKGLGANQLSQAVLMANDYAEEFSADPAGVSGHKEADGLTATCNVQKTAHEECTLYEATIEVSDGAKTVHSLKTARYVADKEGSAR